MAKAIWNGVVLAESDDFEVVEGNLYFPMDSLKREFVRDSDFHTFCGWKGRANYFDVVVDGEVSPNAVWYYPEPRPSAEAIRDRIAFQGGVEVSR